MCSTPVTAWACKREAIFHPCVPFNDHLVYAMWNMSFIRKSRAAVLPLFRPIGVQRIQAFGSAVIDCITSKPDNQQLTTDNWLAQALQAVGRLSAQAALARSG